jgi:copper chaperone
MAMKTLKFKTNINCSNCVRTVTPHLNALMDVESWSVDTENPEKILSVESDTGDAKEVVEAVEKAGFEIKIID